MSSPSTRIETASQIVILPLLCVCVFSIGIYVWVEDGLRTLQ